MIFLPKINDIFNDISAKYNDNSHYFGAKISLKILLFFGKNIIKNIILFGLKYHLNILFCFGANFSFHDFFLRYLYLTLNRIHNFTFLDMFFLKISSSYPSNVS